MSKANELTDRQYWDDAWSHRPVPVVSKYHYLYGRNGIFLRALRRRVMPSQMKRVLELGGANSRFLLALATWWQADVTAVDYSSVGLEQTAQLFARYHCPISLIQDDFLAWEHRADPFDAVVHWGVLEHFRDPSVVLRKCRDFVRPGGLVVFSMPNMAAWGASLWRRWAPRNWEKHVYHSDKVVGRACETAGLSVSDVFHWGPPLFRVCRWERNGLLQTLATGLQAASLLVDYVVPLYHYGHPRISMHRGFVAQRTGQVATD